MEPGLLIAETSFDPATEYFKQFLSREGYFNDLLWVFREDVVFQRENILIKWPVPRDNDEVAANCYELGRERNFGVNLHAFCLLGALLCCYVVLPEDDIDAQYLMMSNVAVKYSVVSDLCEAQPIESFVASIDSNVDGFNTHIPWRRTLLPQYSGVGGG